MLRKLITNRKFDLSVRNQELLKTMLDQQSYVMKMNESSSAEIIVVTSHERNSFTHEVVHKRQLGESLTPNANNKKRKKSFKTAAQLGLKLD